MANQGVTKSQMELVRQKAIELGILTAEEANNNKNLLDADLDLQLWDISNKLENGGTNEESRHRLMLQYGNLMKIRSTNIATKNKRSPDKPMSTIDKAIQKEAEELVKNKYNKTREKAVAGKTLNEEEQEILDTAFDSVLEEEF